MARSKEIRNSHEVAQHKSDAAGSYGHGEVIVNFLTAQLGQRAAMAELTANTMIFHGANTEKQS